MLSARRVLTSAEILGLAATPIPLVAAPGAGRAIVPFYALLKLNFGTVAYLAGSDFAFWIGPLANNVQCRAIAKALVLAGSSKINEAELVMEFNGAQTASFIENQDLNVQAGGAAFTTGDGTLDITVYYAVAQT